jgi:hypothetical protein
LVDGRVGSTAVVVHVGHGLRPDLTLVDALARMQLATRRLGCTIRVDGAGDDLRRLLDLVGLAELLADPP